MGRDRFLPQATEARFDTGAPPHRAGERGELWLSGARIGGGLRLRSEAKFYPERSWRRFIAGGNLCCKLKIKSEPVLYYSPSDLHFKFLYQNLISKFKLSRKF